MSPAARKPVRSLYVHVPFCAHKCEYCAFFSAPPQGNQINEYVAALIRELEIVAPEINPDTIYFGGGTPSLLNLKQWAQILEALHRLGLAGASEWTVECNPATVSPEKARLLRQYGVNRVSMGVQSMDPLLLERLGRVHTREMVFQSYEVFRTAGFDNLNLDVMFAIPGQTMEVWRSTLKEILALQSEHLSCYEVIYEEDTPLFAQLQADQFSVNEDLACEMYEALREHASAGGYHQYEVANFARHAGGGAFRIPDRACRHNVNYWRGGPFFGLGPSASSFVDGVRTRNWPNTRLYCEELAAGRRPIESRDVLSPLGRAGEIAGFGLRMTAGWLFDEFQQTTGFDLRSEWRGEMERLTRLEYAVQDDQGFRLTPLGLRYADWAVELFLRPGAV